MRRYTRLVMIAVLGVACLLPGACGTTYYRLRGSPEIHRKGCPRLGHAQRGGVVYADFGDGPPCHLCLREDALEWAADPY